MLIQFTIDGSNQQFGWLPNGEISVIEIRTSGFPIQVQLNQMPQIKSYLKTLVGLMREEGYVLYNGVLIYKNDINLECLK